MPKSFKPTVLAVFALSVVFTVFFFAAKHVAALVRVNPFAEDPFDAVGGFGVQIALFTSLLCILRAFLPDPTGEASASKKLFIIRGCTVSVQAVAVTLAAYVVAMIRYHSNWIFSPDGRLLAILLLFLTVFAAVTAWRIDLISYNAGMSSDFPARRMALINCLAGALVLGIFPDEWHQGVVGTFITGLLGTVMLLLLTWSLAAALSPRVDVRVKDSLDELSDLSVFLKNKGGLFQTIFDFTGKISGSLRASPFIQSLNPRRYTLRFAVTISIVIAVVMALIKAAVQGLFSDAGNFFAVAGLFGFIEGFGILLGHFLFTKYLGVLRTETEPA